jgi:arsenite methyltransferase
MIKRSFLLKAISQEKKMETAESIKEIVKTAYTQIAVQSKEENQVSCCGSGSCSSEPYSIFSEDYTQLKGYNADADLGLGCGIPTQFANIKKGDLVIDLGSGAGNDAFIVRSIVGDTGKVIGIDMTEAMIEKSRLNNDKLGYHNVEFRLGEIEKIPCSSNHADVVVSNCVLNLVPNKEKAFSEIFRVLKDDGHFCISDVVLVGELPEKLKEHADMYAGCVSSAIQKEDYMSYIEKNGFSNIQIVKQKKITIPDDILERYLRKEEMEEYKRSNTEIQSITVKGEKTVIPNFCAPNSGCC